MTCLDCTRIKMLVEANPELSIEAVHIILKDLKKAKKEFHPSCIKFMYGDITGNNFDVLSGSSQVQIVLHIVGVYKIGSTLHIVYKRKTPRRNQNEKI